MKHTISESDLSYYAGLFDGEGFVGAHWVRPSKNSLTMVLHAEISMSDPQGILDMPRTFGYGNVRIRLNEQRHRPLFSWYVSSRNAERFLSAIYPYVKAKQDQVAIALRFASRIRERVLRGRRLTKEELLFREALARQLSAAKRVDYRALAQSIMNENRANSGKAAMANPELTRRQSLKRVETIDPAQPEFFGCDEIVQANGN